MGLRPAAARGEAVVVLREPEGQPLQGRGDPAHALGVIVGDRCADDLARSALRLLSTATAVGAYGTGGAFGAFGVRGGDGASKRMLE